jgi:hypothetical protein
MSRKSKGRKKTRTKKQWADYMRVYEEIEMVRLAKMADAFGGSKQATNLVDLPLLKDAPSPIEKCNLNEALRDYERDSDACALLLQRDLRTKEVIANQMGWCRWLCVRHPSGLMREWFWEFGEAILSGECVAFAERVREEAKRRGFKVTSEGAALTMKERDEDGKTAA